jgi:uncharacterized protein YbjT (DUF2867 family)
MHHVKSIVMLGATGAVGNHAAVVLAAMSGVERLSLLGRRAVENIEAQCVVQHQIDVCEPESYRHWLPGHDVAICTLGVGQPSKVSKEEFVRIDRDAVLDFASAAKESGIKHFELLSSVGADAASRSFYLRTKGELEEGLKALNFDRLSLFQPSMIITPTNRYGAFQAFLLFIMPLIDPLLAGRLCHFRSIHVEKLGKAIANNLLKNTRGLEILHWREFIELSDEIQKNK